MKELLVEVTQTMVEYMRRNDIAVVQNGFWSSEYVPVQ